jgi:hypothetical protein
MRRGFPQEDAERAEEAISGFNLSVCSDKMRCDWRNLR